MLINILIDSQKTSTSPSNLFINNYNYYIDYFEVLSF